MTDDELARRWAPTLRAITRTDRHTHVQQDPDDLAEWIDDLKAAAAEFTEKWPAGTAERLGNVKTLAAQDKWPAETRQQDQDAQFQSGSENWEDAANAAAGDGPHTGVMVAFYPTSLQQQELAIEGGEPDHELHLTLVYLGEVGAEVDAADEQKLTEAVTTWAASQEPVKAVTNGHGIFAAPTPVTYASVDSPQLPAARQSLVEVLDRAGVPAIQNHGYTPHMTLAYDERRDVQVPDMDLLFDEVVIAFAGTQTRIPLKGDGTKAPEAAGIGNFRPWSGTSPAYSWTTNTTTSSAQVFEPLPASDGTLKISKPVAEPVKAFVSDINGHTLITAPAAVVRAAFKEPTVEDIVSEHMLYIDGKFVGADVPNRNGALWSAGDLQLARDSILYGPLNWLHEARHVIGSLTDANYVGNEKAATGDLVHPHITAKAAVWKWIYPDEAYVIEQASDLQQLWYSMECISKEVACAGPDGCGNTTSYADYMNGAACEHVVQRASVRHFKNPVFLGGAVIVPPTRPGWAEADARVMSRAGKLAEAAFEQAGEPDLPATQWEQLMAQLIHYAEK